MQLLVHAKSLITVCGINKCDNYSYVNSYVSYVKITYVRTGRRCGKLKPVAKDKI